ncbi:MAG: DUF1702 family protein [Bacteroidota bacterium]
MLESERQLREKLASLLPRNKKIPSDRKKPVEGLGLARRSFVSGYHSALSAGKDEIPLLFQNAGPHEVGFMLEGAGMALAILDEMNDADQRYLPILFTGRPEWELKLCAIGVGWASSRLSKPLHWKPEGISNKWIPAISNGYGFHEGLFNPERYQEASFFEVEEDYRQDFHIGIGRALWFVHDGQIEPIAKFMNRLEPSKQSHIWTGIGIACVFNRDHEKKPILTKISSPNESYLIAGFEKAAKLKQELSSS